MKILYLDDCETSCKRRKKVFRLHSASYPSYDAIAVLLALLALQKNVISEVILPESYYTHINTITHSSALTVKHFQRQKHANYVFSVQVIYKMLNLK